MNLYYGIYKSWFCIIKSNLKWFEDIWEHFLIVLFATHLSSLYVPTAERTKNKNRHSSSKFFLNKTVLFFQIESWNFQHLFEKEFFKSSQNFNLISQPIEKMEIKNFWIRWILWGFTKFFFKQMLKVLVFYLENKKVLFLKEIWSKP